MKKVVLPFIFFLLLASCTSDDKSAGFDSYILVNGKRFEPTTSAKYSTTSEDIRRTQFVLDSIVSCPECMTPPPYKRIILNIYSHVSEDIEGTYNLASPQNDARSMTGGYYLSGYPIQFYAGTITIAKLANKRYRLEFNTVKGKFFLGNTSETEFEGYFEGDFKEIEEPYYD